MARLVTPPPESTPAEWGKRLAYLACVLIPALLLVVLFLNDRQSFRQRISWDDIRLTNTPPMPLADFLREIRAAGQFSDQLDLNDVGLLEQLHQACSRHEWVEQVRRVGVVAPRLIQIDLTFRTPVARLSLGPQVHLVDRWGKLLLPLKPDQGEKLVQLIGWNANNIRDTEVSAWLSQAGQALHQLHGDLTSWQIVSLYLVRDLPLDMADLRLRTRGGTFIIWQTLKGMPQEELSIEEKQSRLRIYHERYGSLEAPAGQLLDVRVKEGLQRRPITP